MTDILNLHDFAAGARETLDPGVLAWMEGGATDEISLRENEAAFLRRRLRPRVMRDVSAFDLSTTLLGPRAAMPAGIAPTAQHALFHPDGELATARAAAAAGVPFVASTMSSLTMEAIAEAGGLRWFQLYVQEDRALTERLVVRAEAAGYRALVLTVDAPTLGMRERDRRPGIQPPTLTYANIDVSTSGAAVAAGSWVQFDASITWDAIDWLRGLTTLPVVVKGVLTGEDAALAVEHGAAAVWASNHGGRQLDRVPAAIDVVEEIVRAVGGRADVYVDGGVRRGVDALIALALGAQAVFLGRPALWALAMDGEAGVRACLGMMEAELRNAMALVGARSVSEITREMVV